MEFESTFHISILTALGVIGACVYVGGFFLLQIGLICGNSIAFALSKTTAAALVMVSLWQDFNLSAFLLQLSFFCIGIFGVALRLFQRPES